MKINKQLFEDVLSGKLKGKFVLRNGDTYFSDDLYRNYYNKFRFTHPYTIGFGSYTPKGIFSIDDTTSNFDIIDFIPDTFVIDPEIYSYNKKDIEFIEHFINDYHMKENELTIEIPEGFEIDKDKSTFEKIVFKKKEDTKLSKPRSWKEYCDNFKGQFYYIQDNRNNIATSFVPNGLVSAYKNYVPSKELAEAFLAMMQLMSLRQAWIGDWKPDWSGERFHYCIVLLSNKYIVQQFAIHQALSFPTKEVAKDFMNTFKDLLKIAKPLI